MTPILAAIVGCIAWILIGVITEIRNRLGRRFAEWLLPGGQASTVRIAIGLARVAEWIAPTERLEIGSTGGKDMTTGVKLVHRRLSWSEPAAAMAEIEADLRSGSSSA